MSVALHNGLGKKTALIEDNQFDTMNKSVFISNIFYILAMAFSKASVVFLFLRLFAQNMRWMFTACWATIGLIGVWTVTSIITLSAGCSQYAVVEAAPNSTETCPHLMGRWAYVMAIDVVIELVLLILPCILIIPLQMPFSRRFPIILAFAFRIPVIAFAGVHVKLVYSWSRASNPAYTISNAIIWGHVELCWSLLSASIPNFKTFMRSLSMGFGIDIGVLTTMHGTNDNAIESHHFRTRPTVDGQDPALGTHTAAESEKFPLPSGRVSTGPNNSTGLAPNEEVIHRKVDITWGVAPNDSKV